MEDCDLTRKSHSFQKSSREMFLVKSHQFYLTVNICFSIQHERSTSSTDETSTTEEDGNHQSVINSSTVAPSKSKREKREKNKTQCLQDSLPDPVVSEFDVTDVTKEGCEKASSDQFDLLRVLGQGSFGKVSSQPPPCIIYQFLLNCKYNFCIIGNERRRKYVQSLL